MTETKIAPVTPDTDGNRFTRWLRSEHGRTVCGVTAVACALCAVVIAAVSGPIDDGTESTPTRPDATLCRTASGEDADTCWTYDNGSGWVLNIDHGAYTYVPATGDVIKGVYSHK